MFEFSCIVVGALAGLECLGLDKVATNFNITLGYVETSPTVGVQGDWAQRVVLIQQLLPYYFPLLLY